MPGSDRLKYTYVDSKSSLWRAAKRWRGAPEIGVDLECENNLHHYGAYVSIIQLSTRRENWIVDILKIKEIQPLLRMLENPNIQKIFHNVSLDMGILYKQFRCRPKNVYDTQLAASLLGKSELGLGPLLKKYFSVQKESKFQMANWTRRPLPQDMLDYAAGDTKYLIALRDIFKDELQKKGRLLWAMQEFSYLEKKGFDYKDPTFEDLRGVRHLVPKQRGIIKQLFIIRNKMAKKVNKPVHFVMRTQRLIELSVKPPGSTQEWMKINGVHPIVRSWAKTLNEAVRIGMKYPIIVPVKEKKRLAMDQKKRMNTLSDRRDNAAARLRVERHIILSKDQLQQAAITGRLDSLRPWQRALVS